MTNADKIRAMSDEELADLLADDELIYRVSKEYCGNICKNRSSEGCKLDLEKEPCPYSEKTTLLHGYSQKVRRFHGRKANVFQRVSGE